MKRSMKQLKEDSYSNVHISSHPGVCATTQVSFKKFTCWPICIVVIDIDY